MKAKHRDKKDESQATPLVSEDTESGTTGTQIRFPIVGIGASAGGLDALRTLFTAMPVDTGMGFVLTQHLDAEHQSLLAELLSKYTKMPVVQVENGMSVEPNHIYVIPPNTYMTVSDGVLLLKPPSDARGMRMPIDRFFFSLAADQQDQAIGIIVSGSGTDGTLGVREIKAKGGMVMVQDPETAQYDGMPRSAIATAQVDAVLPLERMPEVLLNYVRHAYIEPTAQVQPAPETGYDPLTAILSLLLAKTGHDFRCYKKGTLIRRIHRRMGITGVEQFDDYLRLLREREEEVWALAKDLFIGVTSFFREAEAWVAIADQVIAPIVAAHTGEGPVRVWVPGCATGEEAYTLAILFAEAFDRAKKNLSLLIFATDVDTEALQVGRAGLYLENIAESLSLERLSQFFTKEGDGYRVKKWLRDLVVFTPQNLIADPPFSKLDLISCRNLLIYLESRLQDKVLRLFHFALKPSGFLVLGSSETLGQHQREFRTLSKKWRIFQPEGTPQLGLMEMPLAREAVGSIPRFLQRGLGRREPSLADMAQQALVETFAPASVLVTRRYQVLYVYGDTSDYLAHPPGELTDDLMAMARSELRLKTRAALHQAIGENRQVSAHGAQIKRGEAVLYVSVTVTPLLKPPLVAGLLLVSFQHEPMPAREPEEVRPAEGAEAEVVRQLEEELKTTREELQSTIEELETSNEELKASNEEVMSMNEELQSSNEELETSKEELQSLNEELTTVNNQLQNKVAEVESTNNDLANLLASSNIATLFLDRHLRIKRFTPATTRLMNLIPSDVGRPVADIAHKYANGDLSAECRQVMDELHPLEREVQNKAGAWYIRRVQPYRTQDNRIEGTVVTFTDVTLLKRREEEHAYLAGIVESSLDAIIGMTPAGIVTTWNPGAEAIQGYRAAEMVGRPIQSLAPESCREEWAHALQKTAAGRRVARFETKLLRKDGFPVTLWATLCPIRNGAGELIATSAICRDVTERAKAEQSLREHERRLIGLIDSAMDAVISLDDQQRIILFNPAAERLFGLPASEALGKDVGRLIPERLREAHAEHIRDFARTGSTSRHMGALGALTGLRANGEEFPIEAAISQIDVGGQRLFTVILRDISERVRAKEALRTSEAQLRTFVEQAPYSLAMLDRDLRYLVVSHRWIRDYGRGHRDLIGRSHYEIHPDLPEAWKQVHRAALGGEHLSQEEDQWVQADGSVHWARWSVQPWIDRGGAIGGILIAAEDITERKQVEQALRESEADLRRAQAVGHIGSWRLDVRSNILTWSEENHQIFGIPAGTPMTYETFLSVVHPEDRAYVDRQWQAGLRGEPYDIEHRLLVDGRVKWVRERAELERDENGQLMGGFGTTQDITERKTAEAQLRRQLTLTKAITECAAESIFVTDVRGRIQHTNPEAERIFGYTQEEFAGQTLHDLLHHHHPDGRPYPFDDCPNCRIYISGGSVQQREVQFFRKDGSSVAMTCSNAGLEIGQEIVGAVLVAHDISLHKESEAALRESDRRKDEFLALLGHELRNPLMPIRSALEVLAREPQGLPERVQWAVDLIGRQSAQLERLVGDLLDVSRITRGRFRLRKQAVDLRRVLRDVMETTAPMLAQHRHHLESRLPDESVVVEGDPLRLAQVFANLLSNAIKYTAEGGRIQIGLEREDRTAVVRVKDSGIGIAAEAFPHLFDFFVRNHGGLALSGDPGGLGLGLGLANRLVRRHGGNLEAFSDGPGQGSEFVVTLPLAAKNMEPETSAPRQESSAQGARRVLVVDDNPDVANSLKVLLEVMGHEVRTLSSAAEVADLVQEWRPEVVFLDIAMPHMDGFQVAAAVRASGPEPHPRLIALTGYGQTGARKREAGKVFDRYLIKPVAAAEIEAVLAELP